MPYVFGPVPSRRLGLSLGVDLIPEKTCPYDCLYCQVGKTTIKTIETDPLTPVREVIWELGQRLEKITPDVITLSGSGEPTLHSQIDQVIDLIKEITDIKIALLTNGSLFWNEEVRKKVMGAHIIMPTLSTASEETFRIIHRPHGELNLSMIIEGLTNLRRDYFGSLFLEVVLLAGLNDSDNEIEGLKRVIDQISPDKIQLNTVVRPPADSRAIPLDRKRLEDIKSFFGAKAEIVAHTPFEEQGVEYDSPAKTVLEMIKRRPVRDIDIANVLNMRLGEVEGLIKGLLLKGLIRKHEHSGDVFYRIPQ
jgi:wyosine [tRNA(Phe)-imidazoG37] synthetase (radical SAM superfamily)